jgi:peptide/nickel transport system substrate-binding protein
MASTAMLGLPGTTQESVHSFAVELPGSNDHRKMNVRRPLLWSGTVYAAALAGLLGIQSLAAQTTPPPEASKPPHGIAMHGQPALPAGFDHFAYVNPNAPKGGRLVWGVLGAFDSLNPLIVKGVAVPQIRGYVFESLLARNYDEPFTLYGLLADTVETDDARDYVTFHLRPEARFSDGHPVTADDVVFSWELLKDHGRYQYYRKVSKAVALDAGTIRFDLSTANDRELPLIIGLMPILPKHATDIATFEQTTLTPPIGSGPYRVGAVKAGASVTLRRDPDYWGKELNVNRGLWNFDEVRIDYFRDTNTAFEAFSRGLVDFRLETEPSRWSTGYDFPAAKDGRVIKETIENGAPQPSDYLAFNTRRPQFADVRVREALTLLYDFEWINKNYFFGLYRHSASYFPGSELSAYGRAEDDRERQLLAPFASEVRADIADGSFRLPVSDATGRDRDTLRRALTLLDQAGYQLTGNVLRRRSDGQPLRFEILVSTRDQERIALAYAGGLKHAGIAATVRVVDAVQFDQRRLAFDFDVTEYRLDQSLSPGNEQSFYFGSKAAENQGTRNYMGVKSAGVDAMIGAMLEFRERPDFVASVRALDRLLMSGFYTIPLFNMPDQWFARWSPIARPANSVLVGYLPETWWRQPQ